MNNNNQLPVPVPAVKRFAGPKINKELLYPYLLIVPTLVLIIYILFIPIMNVFSLSFQDYALLDLSKAGFVGLDNFKKILFEDKIFFGTLGVTARWVVTEVFFQLLFGLAIALMLNCKFRGRGIARSVIFLPWAVSGVLTTMIWSLMLNQHVGLVNDLLLRFHIIEENIAWLANPKTVFNSVVVTELWRGIPFFAITLLAALQTIPLEVYESGKIDGCSRVKALIYITLPFIKESIVLTTLLRAIWEFNNIDLIYTITGGGPFYLTTTLPLYLMQTAIVESNYGYGSALAVVVFLILMAFTVFYLKISRFGGELDD